MSIPEDEIQRRVEELNTLLHKDCEGVLDEFIRRIAIRSIEDGTKIVNLVFEKDALKHRP